MFSKKPQGSARQPAADRRSRSVVATTSNPYLGAGAAGLLFVTTLAVLVFITADDKAGAPVVRLSLEKAAASGARVPGWRERLSAERPGEAPLTPETYQLSEGPLPPIGGMATITLPSGARTEGEATGAALPRAPLAGLTETGPADSLLPIIADDRRTPAQAYARPFTSNGKPKVALVIGGLGLNPATTRRAIEELPPEITLSFAPYAEGLQGWIDLAREHGHEVLLEAPMEPLDYPANDPGPYTLLAGSKPDEMTSKLEWLLSRATGYFGLTNYLGSRFMATPAAMSAFTGQLRRRGLAFVDDGQGARTGGGVPRASAARIVDEDLSAAAIEQQLLAVEGVARQRGQALGSGFAYPITIEQAATWARGVHQRGLQLAPASAVTARR